MNITTQATNMPIPTVVNPPTDALRRENHQREIITQPVAAQQSAAEKGVASDKDRAKTPAQNNEQIDFEQLRKRAEAENASINGEASEHSENAEGQEQHQDAQGHQSEDEQGERHPAPHDEHHDDSHGSDYVNEQVIRELQSRDREVRSHEQAHAAAGGAYTGAPSYTFEVGPDGKKYAVEGEVSVDLSPVQGDPRATIAKLQKVYNAALAPANPSIQDTRVANKAAQLIVEAQSQILAQSQDAATQSRSSGAFVDTSENFAIDDGEARESDFDRQINQTLNAQEKIAPSRPSKIDRAAVVIESLYSDVNAAYEKPPRFQFELTA